MCKLESKTREMVVECEALMAESMKEIGIGSLLSMNEKDFNLIKRSMKLMKDATELAVMQAKVIDEMNEKLDLIVKKLEKES